MISLSALSTPVIAVCVTVYFFLAALQTFHTVSCFINRTEMRSKISLLYETCVLLHLVLIGTLLLSPVLPTGTAIAELFRFNIPLSVFLYFNVVPALLAIAVFRFDPHAMLVAEVILYILALPAVADSYGTLWFYYPFVHVAYFTFRQSTRLLSDRSANRTALSSAAITETLDQLPEGVLYIGDAGRVLFMNETMRNCLICLGLPTDLADARTLWPVLQHMSSTRFDNASRQRGGLEQHGITVQLPTGIVRYFAKYPLTIWDRPCECILAYDVTEEIAIERRMAQANSELEKTSSELQNSIESVQMIADNEALLKMRANVHDVIGQRVSILHRYMEDGDVSDETIGRIEPLLTGMLAELGQELDVNSATTLDAVIDAFSVIGVSYQIHGQLPKDLHLSRLFVQIIRESSTNAVRHGQADEIYIHIWDSEAGLHLSVGNNGAQPSHTATPGSGIRGMQNAVEEFGGTLTVATDSLFTIQVLIPVSRSSDD